MISKKMKYAVKALCYLTKNSNKETMVRTIEIAESENIPKKFLEQILLELKKARLVNSKQGNVGGYYLIKDAAHINLAELYRLFEGPIALLPCASETRYESSADCTDEQHCAIKKAAQKGHYQTLNALAQISIAELAEK